MEYTKPFKGSMRYHRWCILSCVAAAMERRCWIPLGGLGKVYPNMYVVICGGPGRGKTIVSNLATSFIKKYNFSLRPDEPDIKFGPDKVTPAALLKRFQRCTKTIKGIPELGTIEQSAMYMHSTELSTFIRDIGGGAITDDLLKLYDCDDYFEKELIKDGVIKIPYPCLNLLADTTPAFLSGFLPREESGTGLTARIIFVTEFGRVEMDEEVPDGDSKLASSIVAEFARVHALSGPFRFTLDAKEWWKEWWKKHQVALYEAHEGSFMSHFYARKPVHMRKVAMLLSAARDSSRIIQLEDLENALEFINDLEPNMAKSFGVQDFKRTADLAKVILDLIPMDRDISKGDLINAMYYSGVAGAITDLNGFLTTLLEGRLITERTINAERMFKRC